MAGWVALRSPALTEVVVCSATYIRAWPATYCKTPITAINRQWVRINRPSRRQRHAISGASAVTTERQKARPSGGTAS